MYLILSYNQFTGAIPPLNSLENLYDLELHNNYFTKLPEFSENLKSLTSLSLGFNKLESCIPSTLGRLPQLIALFLENNALGCSIPRDLSLLRGLKQLELDHNNLIGRIPSELGALNALETFHLQNNQLSGEVPEGLGSSWNNVVSFDISSNKFNGTIPKSIESMACKYLSKNGTQCNMRNNMFDESSCSINKCAVNYCNACEET